MFASKNIKKKTCVGIHVFPIPSPSHPIPQALLSAPNPDDPLANDVAEMWKSNEAQAMQTGACVVGVFSITPSGQ